MSGAGVHSGPFASRDEAARAALDYANPRSIANNREYGGLIYRTFDGGYWFSGPVVGKADGVNPRLSPIPRGAELVGNYHTHGDYSLWDPNSGDVVCTSNPARDDYNSDQFSTTDKDYIRQVGRNHPGYKGYLGTPSGTYKTYDPETDSVDVLW